MEGFWRTKPADWTIYDVLFTWWEWSTLATGDLSGDSTNKAKLRWMMKSTIASAWRMDAIAEEERTPSSDRGLMLMCCLA